MITIQYGNSAKSEGEEGSWNCLIWTPRRLEFDQHQARFSVKLASCRSQLSPKPPTIGEFSPLPPHQNYTISPRAVGCETLCGMLLL